ncbi:conserved hypothetical protein [Perkinsus marinus ATCC 50983]|uniref:Mitochondrial import inner membrane translocase subunit TIM22 n=1 Tax=Perkinsus marinus (strain ATCC 50983 / TXsc) TaxID=423536 RepID=C5KLD2_PERM5|nr:conserved hypothetical protein [Perkinsus marinus ATCC 50983]XP_002782915.1 conserved hypothetical protein [Perkinsus marinus ATCC 50983]EER01990.1 conserved hypothetical protein [Perkinsus marinus ATCC 50983]EER14711.1 conserved hypothetical protein [Perkinsus marinus ATCC 50983]|eukprot:XP_002769272.1 conserved hypothetical protein [Perkinsus marinus ATCC 50983]
MAEASSSATTEGLSTAELDRTSPPPTQMDDTIDIFLRPEYRHLSFVNKDQAEYSNLTYWQRIKMNPQVIFESCIGRAVSSYFMGGALGLLMGGFFHTMQPIDVDASLPFRQQVRQAYKGFGQASLSMAKGFAVCGAVYSGVDCFVERARGSHDLNNSIYAGCLTGAALAYKGGPQAMAMGCAGFAAFSIVIDSFMSTGDKDVHKW